MTDERDDLDRELEELDAEDTFLLEYDDGSVYDLKKLRPILEQMINMWVAAFPQQAAKLAGREPGVEMRPVGDGIVEVFAPSRAEGQEE